MGRGRWALLLALGALSVAALAACSEEERERFANKRVIEALRLEQSDSSFTMGGDPFCVVKKILNDADEVDSAGGGDKPILASRNGNVGIEVGELLAPDCEAQAKRQLNRLDPKPKE